MLGKKSGIVQSLVRPVILGIAFVTACVVLLRISMRVCMYSMISSAQPGRGVFAKVVLVQACVKVAPATADGGQA